MNSQTKKPFDLEQRAENGLRRGVTTGTCATAAVKAALYQLLAGRECSQVTVNLIDDRHCLTLPIFSITQDRSYRVKAMIIKDAGDDPDATHRAKIFAIVQTNDRGQICFKAGKGVGTITQPGFAFPIGEPAINPVPRKMMIQAVREVIAEIGYPGGEGFDLEIGCVDGEEIAKKTYNPRLGIINGISILGTTGIVEPKSLSSYLASIALYIRIAVADRPPAIVLSPGNIGQRFASQQLDFPLKRIVQMSNFVGFSLDALNQILEEYHFTLPCLWVTGHPGKLAKLLDRAWDTHSSHSATAVEALCQAAHEFGIAKELIQASEKSVLVEQVIRVFAVDQTAPHFWRAIEHRIEKIIHEKTEHVQQIQVRLITMKGELLQEDK